MIGVVISLLMALVNLAMYAVAGEPISLFAAAFCGLCALVSAVASS